MRHVETVGVDRTFIQLIVTKKKDICLINIGMPRYSLPVAIKIPQPTKKNETNDQTNSPAPTNHNNQTTENDSYKRKVRVRGSEQCTTKDMWNMTLSESAVDVQGKETRR